MEKEDNEKNVYGDYIFRTRLVHTVGRLMTQGWIERKITTQLLVLMVSSVLLACIAGCGQSQSASRDVESGNSACSENCQCQVNTAMKQTDMSNDGFGIDVSHHNGEIDWNLLKSKQDLMFVYVKATEGATHIDVNFKENFKGAKDAGYRTGSYHFFRMTSSAHAQFDNFHRAMASVGRQDLIPMVDVETSDKHSVAELQDSLKAFIQLVKDHYGVYPMIYGTNRSYNTYCGPEFNKYHLYIGRYGAKAPVVRGVGTYTIWQYSEKGKLPGIPKPVDLARFHPDHSVEEILL